MADESRTVLLAASTDQRKTTRRLSLPGRKKINEKGLINRQTNTKMSVSHGSRPKVNYFPTTLGEIAEDDHEWVPETPPKVKMNLFFDPKVKSMANLGIKDHPVKKPGVYDQIMPSKVKHTRRSTIIEVTHKPKKKEKPKEILANLDPARLNPVSEGNYI